MEPEAPEATETADTPSKAHMALGCVGLIAILALAAFGVRACGSLFSRVPGGPEALHARLTARDAISERLVAPGSAKWPAHSTVARSRDGHWVLQYQEVDAQNRMGALVRSYWLVLVRIRFQDGEPFDGEAIVVNDYANSPTVADGRRIMDEWIEPEDWLLEADWKAEQKEKAAGEAG